jgi:hypothetical protein
VRHGEWQRSGYGRSLGDALLLESVYDSRLKYCSALVSSSMGVVSLYVPNAVHRSSGSECCARFTRPRQLHEPREISNRRKYFYSSSLRTKSGHVLEYHRHVCRRCSRIRLVVSGNRAIAWLSAPLPLPHNVCRSKRESMIRTSCESVS